MKKKWSPWGSFNWKGQTLTSEVSGEIQSISAENGDVISSDIAHYFNQGFRSEFPIGTKKANYENVDAQYKNLVEFDYASAKEDLDT